MGDDGKKGEKQTFGNRYNQALYYEIFVKGEYVFAKEYIQTANTIFDIGGHIGLFSERCLTINPKAIIYYFEPFKQNRKEAKKRLKKWENQVFFNTYALGNSERKQTFFFNHEKTMQSSAEINFLNPQGERETITVKTLDNYITKHKIPQIDLLKIDIEGMEFEVLENISEENREKIETIICEIHLFSEKEIHTWEKIKGKLRKQFNFIERIPSTYNKKIGLCFCKKEE